MQQPIELILLKQVVSQLALPAFLVDPDGALLFYNEQAEVILGRRYDEAGELPRSVWTVLFRPEDREGRPLPPESLPLVRTLEEQRPVHGGFLIMSLDGQRRELSVTAVPLIGLGDRFLGALAIFWEESGDMTERDT
jgi:PAS domain-containing protein